MKALKNTLVFLFYTTIICSSHAKAQSIKTYSGPYRVGYGLDGDGKATYTYFDDAKTLERVKQGPFNYLFNSKNGIGGSFVKKVTGGYNKGYKNGTWTYNLTYNDYSRTENDLTLNATGTVSLIAPYINGLPNGIWLYRKKILIRNKKFVLNRAYATAYEPFDEIAISISFRNGFFSGPFSMVSKSLSIIGSFDGGGNMDGQWTVKTKDNEEITKYDRGLVMQRVNRSMPNGEVLAREINDPELQKVKDRFFEDDLNETRLNELGYTAADYRNVFISKLINIAPYVFNDSDFMYTTLRGDKMIEINSEGDYINKINYRGGNFYRIKKIQYGTLGDNPFFKKAKSAIDRVEQEVKDYPLNALSDLRIAKSNLEWAISNPNNDELPLKESDKDIINAKIEIVEKLITQLTNKQ